jgi:hypothetical protein
MNPIDFTCSVFLYLFSLYHVITGIISMFFPNFAMSFYKSLYGYDPIERKHLVLILKPWGALAAFAGFVGLFAARDPKRYLGVVLGLALLLLLRIYYRLRFERELLSVGGIPPQRNRVSLAILLFGVLILGAWLLMRL